MPDQTQVNPPNRYQKSESEEDLDVLESEDSSDEEKDSDEETKDEEEDTEESEEEDEEKSKDTDKEDEEDKEETEEEPEPVLTDGRVRFKDIKGKYPKIFREFPELASAIARDKKYSELFPTVEDAQEAQQNSEYFKDLETSLLAGNSEKLLNALNTTNADALKTLATDFLPTLAKVDRDTYFGIVENILVKALDKVQNDGKRSNNTNMVNAVLVVSDALFGTQILPKQKEFTRREEDPDRKKLEEDKQKFFQMKYGEARASITKDLNSDLEIDISKAVSNVTDDYKKISMAKDIADRLDKALVKDSFHMNNVNALWKRASQNDFSEEWRGKIRGAVLSRARQMLPGIIKIVKNEALKGKVKSKTTPKVIPSGREMSANPNRKLDPKKIDWKKTTDADILNDRIKVRES